MLNNNKNSPGELFQLGNRGPGIFRKPKRNRFLHLLAFKSSEKSIVLTLY